jgi:hypothetical protein
VNAGCVTKQWYAFAVVAAVGASLGGLVVADDSDLAPAHDTTTTERATSTSTSTPTATSPPTSTSDTPGSSTIAPASRTGFVEDFNGNPGALDRFRFGVLHRDADLVATTQWEADHVEMAGADCTPPDQHHTVHRDGPESALYVCASVGGDPDKGHLMTTMGDTSGYSFVWFAPQQTFDDETVVSWDQSVSDLGIRKWTEIMIVPVDGPDLACMDSLPCDYPNFVDESGIPVGDYPVDAIVFGNGPVGRTLAFTVNGVTTDTGVDAPDLCQLDPEGCVSVAIRRPFSITENSDGTITFDFNGNAWTVPGEFPDGEWKVVFSDHTYTPSKDPGPIAPGMTWHWDNIRVH